MDELDKGFDTFTKCAYRLEILPQYAFCDAEEMHEFEHFIKGEKIEGFANHEWLGFISQWRSEDKVIERIRVIPPVITDYFEYEFLWCYPRSIESGEIITFVTYEDFISVCGGNLLKDFWAFDKEKAVILLYDEKNEYYDCLDLSKKEVDAHLTIFNKLRTKAIDYEHCKNSIKWKHL